VSGNPTNFSADDNLAYVAGGKITIDGFQYIQGLVYSKADVQFVGTSYVFGAVVVRGGGTVSGNPIVVFNTALRDHDWIFKDLIPVIVSWQEIYE